MAHRQSIQNRLAVEKPNRDTAVKNTLNTVTYLVPKRLVTRSDSRLEQMVPPLIIMEI